MVNPESRKLGDFLKLAIGLMLLVNLNLMISRLNFRLDLTGDKRYTIAQPVIQMLKDLDDVVYIDVYLEGDFPPGFRRLKNSTRDILEEFSVYAGPNIQYNFIDPLKIKGEAGRRDMVKYLGSLGIQPTNLYANENGKKTEKLIFPGAVISYGGKETGVMLLKGNKMSTPQERLNQSVEGLEYELASSISKMVNVERKRIGFITGHGELDSTSIASAKSVLNEYYDVLQVNLSTRKTLDGYDAIILVKPVKPFSEADLYKIDQFIMKGGKALFLLDVLHVDEDSISFAGTIGYPLETNLDNMLFRYGVRINQDFVLDLNSGAFPVVTGNLGNSPKFQLMQWPFYPLFNSFGNHPIVRNLDALYSKFASSIDTVKSDGVTKIPLVFSSPYTRIVNAPVRVSLNDLREEMKPEIFNHAPAMVSCLLEGNFTSLYKNRVLPDGVDITGFRAEGISSRIILFADGDIIRNGIDKRSGTPYEMGYDPDLQVTFANKDFLVNVISYLVDDNGIILSRSREVKLRPLDKIQVTENKTFWQLINLLFPVLLVIIFGITRHWFRIRKYAGKI